MRRRSPRRLVLPALPVLLLALAAPAGCSDDEAPSDASEERFCEAFNSLSDAETGEDFHHFAARLREVGTPPDISNDGRAGFEVVIRVAAGLEADASLEELEDPDVSSGEAQQAQEFLEYGSETCASLDGSDGGL